MQHEKLSEAGRALREMEQANAKAKTCTALHTMSRYHVLELLNVQTDGEPHKSKTLRAVPWLGPRVGA
jgi:hypothetical protein